MLSMIFLNEDERAQLRAQHKREREGRVRDRIKAVLLHDKGWSIAAIVVEDRVIVEIKSASSLAAIHQAQLLILSETVQLQNGPSDQF